MIDVYYGFFDVESNVIVVSAKEYYDVMGVYAYSANGRDEIVDDEHANEPYNYFNEISEALLDIGCVEDSESIFDIDPLTIEKVVSKMSSKGFRFIHNADLDN